MQDLKGLFGGAGGLTLLIFIIILFIAAVLIPINVYFAQRHARACRDELKKLNSKLANLIDPDHPLGSDSNIIRPGSFAEKINPVDNPDFESKKIQTSAGREIVSAIFVGIVILGFLYVVIVK